MSLNGTAGNHVPAWKRLGLSLKSANPGRSDQTSLKPDQDVSARPLKKSTGNANGYHDDNRTNGSAWTTKRKHEDLENPRTEVKKPKLAHSSASPERRDDHAKPKSLSESAKANGTYAAEKEIGLKQSALRGSMPDPASPKKRKSVSFTLETKDDDGDAANGSKEQAEEVDQELVASAEQLASEAEAASKKAKSKKKHKTQDITSVNSTIDQPLPAYLDYLRQYRDDRTNWKFNKVKQTQLLANAFSIRKVPPEYEDALTDYIATLQGAAAKQRLSDAGEDVKAELEKSNAPDDGAQSASNDRSEADDETTEAPNAALDRHVRKQKERRRAEEEDEEHENKVIKRRRTERILQLLQSNSLPTPNPSFSSLLTTNGNHIQFNEPNDQPTSRLNGVPGKAKRKRKLRTGVPDDDDSSSSSSSSSEDASEPDSSSSESESQSDSDSSDSDSDSDSDSSSTGSATATTTTTTTTSKASTSDDDSSDGGSSDESDSDGSDDGSDSS